ncbi:MAG: hypothetical protein U9N01_04440 [Euryarchaeota archaeon]|nr:hypothetical protein [Euryarchaeota archaeon]
MKRNKVREVQDYLHARGIDVAETAIVNLAIELVERLGAGKYTFACEFELEQKEFAKRKEGREIN